MVYAGGRVCCADFLVVDNPSLRPRHDMTSTHMTWRDMTCKTHLQLVDNRRHPIRLFARYTVPNGHRAIASKGQVELRKVGRLRERGELQGGGAGSAGGGVSSWEGRGCGRDRESPSSRSRSSSSSGRSRSIWLPHK